MERVPEGSSSRHPFKRPLRARSLWVSRHPPLRREPMASCWIERRSSGGRVRYRVRFRLGGRESKPHYGGSFATMREARLRRSWIEGEFASMRVPNLAALAE